MTRVLDPRHAPLPVRLVCDRCGRRSGWHKQGRFPRDWDRGKADGSHRCQTCRFKPHKLRKRRRRERREEAQRRVDLMRVYDD